MNILQTALLMKKKFTEDMEKIINGDYQLDNGQKVKGQSFSYAQRALREIGWRSMTDGNVRRLLGFCGYTVSRGRGMRAYRGGVYKLGVSCDVIHRGTINGSQPGNGRTDH